jgi:hypothetical protein
MKAGCINMKTKLQQFLILFTIALSTFTLANKTLFPTVDATYVEGAITQDTVWTLVESPFILSKDVTVYPNATLTIEPGVEVRFGQDLSLSISGRLYANGTSKTITFTSNMEQPSEGDWNTIKFGGTEKSTLIDCFIAYAKDGILAENGAVEVEDSTIKLCSQNGINGTNSELTVQDSTIMENTWNGICVIGNGQTNIQRNTIMANGNGILLTGTQTSGVNINQNKISANTQNGIQIDAENHNDITIANNDISSNDMGFNISSPKSTNITENSISYNNVGMFYNNGGHTAYYNDIYGNEMGMDVSVELDATVNAEYNYWGDSSGPYHESLNPTGKGNRVGGNGVNLDFIFFLTKPIDYINVPPTANLLTDKNLVLPDDIIMFFATNSVDEGSINWYYFDFGDGNASGWTTLSVFTHRYYSAAAYVATARVMDDFGAISSDTVTINVQEGLLPLSVGLDISDYVVRAGEQVSITAYVTSGTVAQENAAVTLFAVKGENFSSGLTGATGYFTATFTAPNVTQMTNVRIIATASKSGYTDCSDHEYLEISPVLAVEVFAVPNAIKRGETAEVTVYVKSNGQPVEDAVVDVSSDSGSLSTTTGTTNPNGTVSFVFTAPQTAILLDVNITATATKSGYIEGEGQTMVTVYPSTLNVQMEVSATTIKSGETATVTVHVIDEEDATPIANASVTVSSSHGNFLVMSKTTDPEGSCAFVFNSPQTTAQLSVIITANVTKNGYMDEGSQTTITVTPKIAEAEGGWPITTILLIIIPIAIVVIVAVLIKLKVITVTSEEE